MQQTTTITAEQITGRVQGRSIKSRGVEMLKAKIERLGYLPERPLLVMSDGNGGYELLDGNHRLEAALALGMTTFPIHVVTEDLDDSAKKRRARQNRAFTRIMAKFMPTAATVGRYACSPRNSTARR